MILAWSMPHSVADKYATLRRLIHPTKIKLFLIVTGFCGLSEFFFWPTRSTTPSRISIESAVFLARSANLPEGLYILLALISSFFFIFFYYEQSYFSIAGPIFTIISPNGRYLHEFS